MSADGNDRDGSGASHQPHGAGDVRVRPLVTADVPAFLDLVDALADYEHLPRPDAAARVRLAADATAAPPRFEVLLADVAGRVAGYAFFFMTYSSFLARPTLYLEDLFVHPDWRGRGAGRRLFEACAAEAVRRGCGRMEWVVLDWNTPAIEFYRRRGARLLSEWLPFRLEGPALAAHGDGAGGLVDSSGPGGPGGPAGPGWRRGPAGAA